METKLLFNEIMIGRQFRTSSGVIYRKVDSRQAVLYKDKNGNSMSNSKPTTAFYNSKMILIQTS